MKGLHVSISAEPIFNLGGFEVTNSMFTGAVVTVLLIGVAIWSSKKMSSSKTPKGFQNIFEMVVEGLLNLMVGIAGEKKAKEFFPVVATLFVYILFSNWTGLLPGVGTIGIEKEIASSEHTEQVETVSSENQVEAIPTVESEPAKETATEETEHTSFVPFIRPPSADLNSTLALAIFSMVGVQVVGFKYLKMGYLKKFFNFSGPMQFIIGLLELVSELSRILSFSFRLFGNIFAGEVLLSVMLFLLPFLAPLPFIGLEVFVGLIQALVFAILTLVFWQMATIAHDEH